MSLVNDALRKARNSGEGSLERAVASPDAPFLPEPPTWRRTAGLFTYVLAGGSIACVGAVVVIWLLLLRGDAMPAAVEAAPMQIAQVQSPKEMGSDPVSVGEPVPAATLPEPAAPQVTPGHGQGPESASEVISPPSKPAVPAPAVSPPAAPPVPAPTPAPRVVAVAPAPAAKARRTSPPVRAPVTSPVEPGSSYVGIVNVPGVTPLTLEAIIWSLHNPVALINGIAATPGTMLGDVRVMAIESRRVVVRHGGAKFYVRVP